MILGFFPQTRPQRHRLDSAANSHKPKLGYPILLEPRKRKVPNSRTLHLPLKNPVDPQSAIDRSIEAKYPGSMYYRGNYVDGGDAREMGFKRQRIMDQGSSYYATPPGSSYIYNPPPPPPPAYSYHGQPPPFPVVRLRGLPFDCSETEIADFLHGLDVIDVLLVHKGGRFTGEAYCVLGYPLQVDFALQRNRQNIGRRYVEVFRSKKEEYYKAIANDVFDSRGGSVPRGRSLDESKELAEHTGVLWLRGLPFSAIKEDVIGFFKDFELPEKSIHITATFEGRPTGEAFVEFASADDSRAAMAKDRMTIGNRYIELFPSSPEELEEAVSRGRNGCFVVDLFGGGVNCPLNPSGANTCIPSFPLLVTLQPNLMDALAKLSPLEHLFLGSSVPLANAGLICFYAPAPEDNCFEHQLLLMSHVFLGK
ncbi:hypothetical protein BC332_28504 [Capsicum chinense]|nr:hypothetical protein BC332_28504 [Capsicum chinense]